MIEYFMAHLIGDFLLQNSWMAENKGKNSWICLAHVLVYSLPFLITCQLALLWPSLMLHALSGTSFLLILVQHWFQDRFALHMIYMKKVGQSTPDKWPTGPLIIDQVWHLIFIFWILKLTK